MISTAVLSKVSFPPKFPDSTAGWGVLLRMAYNCVEAPGKCEKRKGKLHLYVTKVEKTRQFRFDWGAPLVGHTQRSLKGRGLFAKLPPASWLAMLHLTVMLKNGDRMTSIHARWPLHGAQIPPKRSRPERRITK